jgi:cytosine/adenosine deaminase-related metal-dependent hydrolase
VFPVTGEPIRDGFMTIEGERITGVGRAAPGDDVEDLGNVAVLPGLVNVHTHLEFSALGEPLGSVGQSFPDWVREVLQWRQQNAVPREEAVERGLHECSRLGTTTLGEIAQSDWPRDRFEQAPLHTTVFQELIGPTPARVASALEQAEAHLGRQPSPRWRPGLSPHAPYTVLPDLLEAAVTLSSARRVPLVFHLAESREELELLQNKTGSFFEFLRGLENWDPDLIASGSRPMDYLRLLANAHRALVIHGNYLADDEIAFLAERRDKMWVVYCPRTHRFFRHAGYPLARMLAAGVRVCLGTDSRATSPDLSLLGELREAARRHPLIGPQRILQMGTIEAARALGRDSEVGSLEPGKYADLAVVALPKADTLDPHELLFNSDEPVIATWFRGAVVQWEDPAK